MQYLFFACGRIYQICFSAEAATPSLPGGSIRPSSFKFRLLVDYSKCSFGELSIAVPGPSSAEPGKRRISSQPEKDPREDVRAIVRVEGAGIREGNDQLQIGDNERRRGAQCLIGIIAMTGSGEGEAISGVTDNKYYS
jgi:hypothetical protein